VTRKIKKAKRTRVRKLKDYIEGEKRKIIEARNRELLILELYSGSKKETFILPLDSGSECPLWDRKTLICYGCKIPCYKTSGLEFKKPDSKCWIRDLMYQDWLVTNNMLEGKYKKGKIKKKEILV